MTVGDDLPQSDARVEEMRASWRAALERLATVLRN